MSENRSKFYRLSIDVIYAFIIGISFLQLNDVVTPFERIFQNGFVILGVSLIYLIIISGWDGYHKSIKKQPHTGTVGTFRYVIDLLITLIVYILLIVSKPPEDSFTWYWEIFLYLLPILFTLYVIWDGFKFHEFTKIYPDYEPTVPFKGFIITFYFAIGTLILSFVYHSLLIYLLIEPIYDTNMITFDVVFIGIYIAYILGYRISKRVLVHN